jgi:hypothetical protein
MEFNTSTVRGTQRLRLTMKSDIAAPAEEGRTRYAPQLESKEARNRLKHRFGNASAGGGGGSGGGDGCCGLCLNRRGEGRQLIGVDGGRCERLRVVHCGGGDD